MTTNIKPNVLKTFIAEKLGANHITQNQAQKFGIDADAFKDANVDENVYLELDEIVLDNDLFQQFAVMYTEEKEQTQVAKDKEQEKKEQTQVKDKNGAGV